MTQHPLSVFALAAAVCLYAEKASAKSGKKPAAAAPVSSTLAVGDQAPTVELNSLEGQPIDLATTFEAGDTVLVVLRGYPGYQCGICSRQATGYIAGAEKFTEAGYQIVMVYPGQTTDLSAKAEEFLDGKQLPAGVTMLLDPEYKLVDAYGLRWDAPNETAYPSTFVIKKGGEITWAKVSKGHGGRAGAKAVLKVVSNE